MDDIQLSSIFVAMVRSAPILLFAAMGGLFAERSGVIDLSLEGKMLASAFTSAAVAYATQNPWWGVAAAIAVSCLLSLLHGYVSINQRGNQLVSGMAFNIAVSGLTFVLAQYFFQLGGRTPDLDAGRFLPIDFPGATAIANVPALGWLYGQACWAATPSWPTMAFLAVPLVALDRQPHALWPAPALGGARTRTRPTPPASAWRGRATRRCWCRVHVRRCRAPTGAGAKRLLHPRHVGRQRFPGAGRAGVRQLAAAVHGAGLPDVRVFQRAADPGPRAWRSPSSARYPAR